LDTEAETLFENWDEANATNEFSKLSATSELIPSKQWEPSNLFSLPPAQSDWIGSGLNSINTMDSMVQQVVPRWPVAFLSKGIKWRQLSLIRKSVISNIRLYPSMMLSKDSMPPFVHHLSMVQETLDSQIGPLSRCAGIMGLFH
jgi:hypothetical protein